MALEAAHLQIARAILSADLVPGLRSQSSQVEDLCDLAVPLTIFTVLETDSFLEV